ncbi:Coiled-coil protein [Giardia lamblia P15]|uniref:Coiled-coil protein n=1 Tax=Giardia intestinalis (strain P15) TaxID=658858 RepID=E1F9F8_GIAIA|nr:Coiled-coil protein [Giardia lamblia P15]
MQPSTEYRSPMDTTPLHIPVVGLAAEPAPFPSEMADISSIGLIEGNVPLDLLYTTDYRETPYSMKTQSAQEQSWNYTQIGADVQNPSGESFQKILLILANVTRSINPASQLTGEDMLMALDTILGQNAVYQQQLSQGMIPNVELQHLLQEYYTENQRLNTLIAQQDEERSTLQTQVNVLTKEIQSLERSKEKEIQLVADTYREEISSLQSQLQEQEAMHHRELKKLKDELVRLTPRDLVPKEVQTEALTVLQETLHLSAFDNKDSSAQSILRPPPKKPLGSARVTFDLEESKRTGALETPASSSLATRVVSTVHNNPNIEYDLTTDDMVISQLQESLRQVDGSALQALKLNFEHEIAQLKLELEQVQSQALIMIQQSDYEKNQIYTELIQLRKLNEERQFRLEELQRLLCETHDTLESAREEADNERNTRLKLEQEYAETRDRERSAEMIKEHEMELRADELKEENQQLGLRLNQLQFEYDELRQEYKTVIDLLSTLQGKSLASAVAENAAAELAAIGECAISGTSSRVVPLVESIGLSTFSTAPLIGGIPLIDREIDAQPLSYSETVQTILIASDVNKEQQTENYALITELEIALNQTNNALKQRITETVAAEQQIKELTEQLKFKSTELEDATMELALLKLELEEARKPTDLVEAQPHQAYTYKPLSGLSSYSVEVPRNPLCEAKSKQLNATSTGFTKQPIKAINENLVQSSIQRSLPPYYQEATLHEAQLAQAGFREKFGSLCDDSELSDLARPRTDTHSLEDLQTDMQNIKQLIEESTEREAFYASQE